MVCSTQNFLNQYHKHSIMAIVGFNLDKISVEKLSPIKGKVEVKNNIVIKDIVEQQLTLGDMKKDGLKLNFEFNAVYDPNVGGITINGHILYLTNTKKSRELLKYWEKERKLTEAVAPEIVNTILMKCSVKTLTLAQEVNLPPNISLPSLRTNKPEDPGNYIG